MHFFAAPVRVPASTPYERDPSALPRSWISNQGLAIGADLSSVAAFWTAIDNIGDYQTSSPAGGTARTVVNVSGKGALYGMIGPQCAFAGGATTTWVVTVDGTPYTFVHSGSPTNNYARSVVGTILELTSRFTTAANSGGVDVSTSLAARTSNDSAQNGLGTSPVVFQIRTPLNIQRFVRFDVSLNITVALSGALGTDPLAGYAGAIWHTSP